MEPFRPLSTSEQLAEYLRQRIHNGTMSGAFPGINQLVCSLGVNSVAVTKAVRQLERDGLVVYQGDRKRRRIADDAQSRSTFLKLGVLYYDASNALRHDWLNIKQELLGAGHAVVSAPKTMVEMGMDAERTARMIKPIEVDAWVIYAGSRQILEWFERQEKPVFALHGRHNSVDIASISVKKAQVISSLVDKLVTLGHSRIVMLAREERRKPHLGLLEQVFIDELEANGIPTGAYNIPDWVDSPDGLEKVIHSLFQHTPPTALVVGDSSLLHAVQVHLANRGVLAPKQISLFCNDSEQSFSWTLPQVAHIRWDHRPSVRRILQWANHVTQGKVDRKKSYIKAVSYEGGTLGPAPRSS